MKEVYPTINIPAPVVKIPTPIVNIPKKMEVEGIKEILEWIKSKNNSSKSTMNVVVMDERGNPITKFTSDMTAPSIVGIKNRNTNKSNVQINPATDGIGIGSYDYVSLAQSSTTDTYTYYTGGASGTLVATVVITYTDSTKKTMSNTTKTPVTF